MKKRKFLEALKVIVFMLILMPFKDACLATAQDDYEQYDEITLTEQECCAAQYFLSIIREDRTDFFCKNIAVNLFAQYRLEILAYRGSDQSTALMQLALMNKPETMSFIIQKLLEKKRDLLRYLLSQKGSYGSTVLHCAAYFGNNDILSLIFNTAQLDNAFLNELLCTQDVSNKTAYNRAYDENRTETAQMLTKYYYRSLLGE